MIQSISTIAQSVETKSSTVVPVKPTLSGGEPKVVELKPVEDAKLLDELTKPSEKEAEEKKDVKISQAMLDELSSDIETLHNIGLSFAQHEDTGRTMVEVMDKKTNEIIRQIPAEDVLNMAAKMDEMIGMLFDVKV